MTDRIAKKLSAAHKQSETKLIHIEPEYLVFPPPHNDRCIQNVLYLYNSSSSYCVYKLYSHHPEYYNAKPNNAIIAPRSVVRIWVILRATGSSIKFPPEYVDKFHLCVKLFHSVETVLTVSPQQAWKQAGENVDHRYIIRAFFSSSVSVPENLSISFHPPSHAGAKLPEMKQSLDLKRASNGRFEGTCPASTESVDEKVKKSSSFFRFFYFVLFLCKMCVLLGLMALIIVTAVSVRRVQLSGKAINSMELWNECVNLLLEFRQSDVWYRVVQHQNEIRHQLQDYYYKALEYGTVFAEKLRRNISTEAE